MDCGFIAELAIDGLHSTYTASKRALLLNKGSDGLIQRRITFGRRTPSDSYIARYRNKTPTLLLSTDAMTLIGDDEASAWRPLCWFWSSIIAVAVVGGTILTLLGPPAERAAARPQADGVVPAIKASSRLDAAAAVQPGASVMAPAASLAAPRPPQPDQPTRSQVPSPLDAQPTTKAVLPDASPRGLALVVVHSARPEGAAAVAERLAARAGLNADQVEVGTAGEARSEAVIRFYSEGDHALARRLGKELAGMRIKWRLENYSQRASAWTDQALDIWLPPR